jgi:hypothetical protein
MKKDEERDLKMKETRTKKQSEAGVILKNVI